MPRCPRTGLALPHCPRMQHPHIARPHSHSSPPSRSQARSPARLTSAHAETEPASTASGRTEAAAGSISSFLAYANAGPEPASPASGRTKASASLKNSSRPAGSRDHLLFREAAPSTISEIALTRKQVVSLLLLTAAFPRFNICSFCLLALRNRLEVQTSLLARRVCFALHSSELLAGFASTSNFQNPKTLGASKLSNVLPVLQVSRQRSARLRRAAPSRGAHLARLCNPRSCYPACAPAGQLGVR